MKRRKIRDEEIDPEQTWELGWWRKEFRKLRQDEAFAAIVTLARAINMLRFIQVVIADLPRADTPTRRRQMMNGFFLSGAVLVEAERLVKNMGRHFRDVPEFVDTLAPAIRSDDFREVVGRFQHLRKKSAFHFDQDAAGGALKTRNGDFERFLSSRGTKNKDYYYDLGDMVALQLVTGTFESEKAFEVWMGPFLHKAAAVTNGLMSAADEFIGTQIVKQRVVRRQVREPTPGK
jgi:hypothetical protein